MKGSQCVVAWLSPGGAAAIPSRVKNHGLCFDAGRAVTVRRVGAAGAPGASEVGVNFDDQLRHPGEAIEFAYRCRAAAPAAAAVATFAALATAAACASGLERAEAHAAHAARTARPARLRRPAITPTATGAGS